MRHTTEQKDRAREAAAEALRAAYGYVEDDSPERFQARSRVATKAVTRACQDLGVSHRAIAEAAGISGLLVLRHIGHDRTREQAIVMERHCAERYLEEVRDAAIAHARYLIGQEVDKIKVAERLAITRPTLDKWLSRSADSPERVV